jgi:hypothetical protein
MKKVLAVTALALLTAGFAVAQSANDMGNAPVPGATFATGVVVSTATDSLTIRKDSGETMTVFVDNATVGFRRDLSGARVQVNYTLDANARALATEIRGVGGDMPAPRATTPPVVGSTPITPAPVTTPAPTAPPPAPVTPVVEDDEIDADESALDTRPSFAADRDELPATASNGPAAALLGLLALGGAVALRATR